MAGFLEPVNLVNLEHLETPRTQRTSGTPRTVMLPFSHSPADAPHATLQVTMYRDDLLYRVRNEFLEMPGMRLTLDQAQRLLQLRREQCESVLARLVDSGFLARTPAGVFVQAGSGRAGA